MFFSINLLIKAGRLEYFYLTQTNIQIDILIKQIMHSKFTFNKLLLCNLMIFEFYCSSLIYKQMHLVNSR